MERTLELEIINSLKVFRREKVLLYPTDTVWGIGCDATNEKAVSKIYQIKEREESKSLIILVDSVAMLQQYVEEIPQVVFELIEKTQQPTTIIYQNPVSLAKNIIAKDNTVAIRVVQEGFCHELISQFEKPIVSTSANISGEDTPKSFSEISPAILERVDYVVDLYRDYKADKSSRILRIYNDGSVEVIRD